MSKLLKNILLVLASGVIVLALAFPSFSNQDKTLFDNKSEYSSVLAAKPITPALSQEVKEPDEEKLIEGIIKASLIRLKGQFPPDKRPVLRDAHPKAHGLVRAEFIVLDGLPEELRYGVFKKPQSFEALIRFSAGNVKVQEDTEPQAAGMAIKLLGVEGEKLLESEKDAKTQDFVMINFPTFFVRNLKDYELLHQEMLTGNIEKFFKNRPAELKAILSMRSQPFFNPVQVRYWSQTPYLLGKRAIKFSAIPLFRGENRPPETIGPDFLREVMKKQIGSEDVYYEFAVQFQSDPVMMPIEDPLEIWDEKVSPFQRVALIRIPKQDIDAPGRVEVAENLAFTPWHSIPEHRPLGSMNRARLSIYQNISEFRRTMNNVPLQEPNKIP